MKLAKILALLLFAALLALPMVMPNVVEGQSTTAEAPTGFDNQTNGFTDQATFDADKGVFEERDKILPDANQGGGLGPVYNAQACAECHQNPVTGGISQITEMRAGHLDSAGNFVDAPGGSLIHTRAIDAQIQERVPDGSRIIFSQNGDKIFVMGFDGAQYGEVANDPTGVTYAAFSPDTRKILFHKAAASGIKQIFVMNVDGTNQTQLTNDPGGAINAVWSPDGATIAFVSNRTSGKQIWAMNPDGSNQRNLTNDTIGGNDFPAWSPDSQKLAFQRIRNATMDIWVMNADGSGQYNVTNATGFFTNSNPSWSPDGTLIAFSGNKDGNNEIYKTNLSGTVQTRITNNSANDTAPAWSPDGNFIAFMSTRTSSTFKIFVMAADGSNPFQISAAGVNAATYPHWSSDAGETIRTFRTSLNILGDGFVESILDQTLIDIAANQPGQSNGRIQGQVIMVPVTEGPNGQTRVGRFGWKNQVATLLSFSGDAYLNEQGITNRFFRVENSSLGRSVFAFDPVGLREGIDIPFEDNPTKPADQQDIDVFARFMRSTKAPPRDRVLVANDASDPGSQLFGTDPSNEPTRGIGCVICHVRNITTAPPGTVVTEGTSQNGGRFVVDANLGNKIIHPFSDFLLHDVGTGDGILQNGPPETRNKVRTAPLWGVRTRDRLMHDGGQSNTQPGSNTGASSLTFNEAILRHAGEAIEVINRYRALPDIQKAQLLKFLKSL
jgi:Tol biopolymer transport system component/CxxC motif-containing protein (DUF1111 family)